MKKSILIILFLFGLIVMLSSCTSKPIFKVFGDENGMKVDLPISKSTNSACESDGIIMLNDNFGYKEIDGETAIFLNDNIVANIKHDYRLYKTLYGASIQMIDECFYFLEMEEEFGKLCAYGLDGQKINEIVISYDKEEKISFFADRINEKINVFINQFNNENEFVIYTLNAVSFEIENEDRVSLNFPCSIERIFYYKNEKYFLVRYKQERNYRIFRYGSSEQIGSGVLITLELKPFICYIEEHDRIFQDNRNYFLTLDYRPFVHENELNYETFLEEMAYACRQYAFFETSLATYAEFAENGEIYIVFVGPGYKIVFWCNLIDKSLKWCEINEDSSDFVFSNSTLYFSSQGSKYSILWN